MAHHVLVTGAAGYVGTHVLVELIEAGFAPVAIDNRPSALTDAIQKIYQITGHMVISFSVDLLDKSSIAKVFDQVQVEHVLHLAGLKAVRESQGNPLIYYNVNVIGTISLLEVMDEHGVHNIIFSSSSKVYGVPQYLPLDEKHPTGSCTNPYGRTKHMVENILHDLTISDVRWNVTVLRYFNPSGAHSSGILGEDQSEKPRNLMPCICHVAEGKMKKLTIFGKDYDTPDGTAMKGYTHVVDLAKGHIAALKTSHQNGTYRVYNLGAEKTYSILDMVKMFEQISGKKIVVEFCDRKPGEIAVCSADSSKAFRELRWKTDRTLKQMCEDMWHWMTTEKPEQVTNGHVNNTDISATPTHITNGHVNNTDISATDII
ncbi:UDP-glucose 4-epimerase-like isoform X3 [Mercenaria mercenaria]|uniref:UDP-glucose 4-epimerase-like isoform X3 n=1 Tax=Mercenaria mercenaria TaxID=6596 RepID=UPI00234FA2FB|nr:UDP-glucose 4-epimerase-like isoform X3 [Mercenaria mercenaria]